MTWETKKLGEICEISTGKSNTEDAVPDGKYAFFDRSKTVKKSSKYLFDCDAIIVAGEGQTFMPKFYSGKFDLHQRAYALFNFAKNVSISYVYAYLIYIHKYFESVAVGATAKSLRLRHFQDLLIPLPPLSEQKRIVVILDKTFAAISDTKINANKNLENARNIFRLYVNTFFLNADRKWKVHTLGEFCTKVEYGTSAKSSKQGKVPVIRMGNIQNGKIDWSALVYSNDDAEIKKYLLKMNDVLFNRTNSPELVGKTAIYKGEMPAIFAGYLIRIHRKENLLDADYLNYFLNSDIALNYGKTVTISSVNQANINGEKLKHYPIVIPPLSEQKRMVNKFDAIFAETKKLELLYQKKIIALEEIQNSILEKAFKGELTEASV